jgi:type I restriction-modification system DNA methylase subunit
MEYTSEKESEFKLQKLLNDNDFNDDLIHYTIFSNDILKELFSKCSKTGNKYGIPDRIYLDISQNTLIIFECKSSNLEQARKDIKFYINNLIKNDYKIYGVAFINNNLFSIYKLEKSNIIELKDKLINLSTFNLKKSETKYINMNSEIHKVHSYIRDYTKISNEDKAFFIAIILISIKKSSFEFIFNKFKNKEYIYDIVLDNLNDYDIDINVFKFLRNDENNIHLYHLIKMIFNIYEKNPSIDLLNEFYGEFVKYNNTDGKNLGIVLTPPHIIKLMNEMLKINENDIVLDLCTGTGSYLMEANKYNPKQLIGCEYQNKLFALFKCNTILRDITNIDTIKGNCFDFTFKATKSIINPPYSIKSEPEFEFILKQLNSLEEGGLAVAIIPISNLSNNKINNKYKEKLLLIANIKAIIICRNELFNPHASVKCVIMLFEKNSNGNEIKTKIINYEDDGFELIKQSGNIKTERYEQNYIDLLDKLDNGYEKELIVKSDWQELEIKTLDGIDIQELLLSKLENEYIEKKMKLLKIKNYVKYKSSKNILLKDLFDVITSKNILLKDYKDSYVGYNIISSSDKNNGIHINKSLEYNVEGNCLTLNKNGSVGYCYYQSSPFVKTCDVMVLKSKSEISKNAYIYYSNVIFKTCQNLNFNWSNKINIYRFNKIMINVPINDAGDIDYEYIETLF